ncbi:hypothetical protein BUALT_Bualt04G0007700 [Buddleja alternifolia]|uniref:Oxidoreductase-like domain-containing protein n=1 Tax=Buddleja alternifolia TaxID=168488 RepID=A0AAV6XTE5_9LAMI|nr:hypothetical protein BUALT_Bualt04G0007700 [Buddleja alternifolia]
MLLRDLTLRRITTTTTPYQQFRSNRQNLNNISVFPKSMADESKKTDIQPEKDESATKTTTATTLSVSGSKEEKQTEKSTPSIPPPPEKPLPGDCCGSGCVSCVWDLYYEELEEYNKIYKANST